MNKLATSINQSKRLIKLGIDTKTADMHWRDYKRMPDSISYPTSGRGNMDEDLPAWSLSALLNTLTDYVCVDYVDSDGILTAHNFKVLVPVLSYDSSKKEWICKFEGDTEDSSFRNIKIMKSQKSDPVDSVYTMLCAVIIALKSPEDLND